MTHLHALHAVQSGDAAARVVHNARCKDHTVAEEFCVRHRSISDGVNDGDEEAWQEDTQQRCDGPNHTQHERSKKDSRREILALC